MTLVTLLTCIQMAWESAWSQVRIFCCDSKELPYSLILFEHLHMANLQATVFSRLNVAHSVAFIDITVMYPTDS